MRRHIELALATTAVLVLSPACAPRVAGDDGEGEGEGETSQAEGEGEGASSAEGEGEGASSAEGEGEGEAPATTTFFVAGTAGAAPRVSFDNSAIVLTIGSTTRAQASQALGVGVADANNNFRVNYAQRGVVLQYVDADGVFDEASAAGAATDVLARVLTLPGANVATDGFHADNVVGGVYSEGAGDTTVTLTAGKVGIDATEGLQVVVDATNVVTTLVLCKPQASSAPWTQTIDLSTTGGALGSIILKTSTFTEVQAALGTAFDAEGTASIATGLGSVDVFTRTYASFGVRVAFLLCNSAATCASKRVQTISLSPPFLGKDGTLGLGSSRADIDAGLGVAGVGPDSNGLVKYGSGASPLGVLFVNDDASTPRAATFVMGYTAP